MNIKIVNAVDPTLIEGSYPFGSRVYGTQKKGSDFDILHILKHDTGDIVLHYQSPLKFVDSIYMGMPTFMKNLKTGGDVIPFEVMHSEEFLLKYSMNPMDFYSYHMAKAYIGLAKRDLKHPDRTFHINRCLFMAKKIMKKELIDISSLGNIEIERNHNILREEALALRQEVQKWNT